MAELLGVSRGLLEKYPLCDRCLGRQFSSLAPGAGNLERGRAIKLALLISAQALGRRRDLLAVVQTLAVNGGLEPARRVLRGLGRRADTASRACYLCNGAMDALGRLAERVVEELKDLEYSSILVGCKLPVEVEEREDELKTRFKLRWGESVRFEVTREVSNAVRLLTGKAIERRRPDVAVVVNPFTGVVDVTVNSVFFKGRYRKLVPGISQTRRRGGDPLSSVEGLLAAPLLEASGGGDVRFHGAGREDVDATMKGPGRPFVIEVLRPRRRSVDLRRVEEEVDRTARGRVEVLGLENAEKRDVDFVKSVGERARKVYRAMVEVEGGVSEEEVQRLGKTLSDADAVQRTPTRVVFRRGDRTRQKHLYAASFRRVGPSLVEAVLECEAGLYVKELVSGDEGRTRPSISEILGRKARCVELEVIDIREA